MSINFGTVPLPELVVTKIEKHLNTEHAYDFFAENEENYGLVGQYLHSNPEITFMRSVLRRPCYLSSQTETLSFLQIPWEAEITSEAFYSQMFILIPERVPLSELGQFTLTVKFGEVYQNRFNLAVLPHLTFFNHNFEIKTTHGYHWIPVSLMDTHNDIFDNLVGHRVIKIGLESRHRVETQFKYFSYNMGEHERRIVSANHGGIKELFMQHLEELSFDRVTELKLPVGYISYLIWRTDQEINWVKLLNRVTGKELILSRGDFQYLERLKLKLPALEKNWGGIYFCYDKYVRESDTGGLQVKDENHYSLHFPKEVSGKMWLMTRQVWRYKEEDESWTIFKI